MSSIRVANLLGGFLFGTGILLNLQAGQRWQTNLIQATIISQSDKSGNAQSHIDVAKNEEGFIIMTVLQTGIGAALACLRKEKHE